MTAPVLENDAALACMVPTICPLGPEPHEFVPPTSPGLCCTRQPWENRDEPSVTCPRCGRTSYHPRDIAEGYCGACHDWTGPGR